MGDRHIAISIFAQEIVKRLSHVCTTSLIGTPPFKVVQGRSRKGQCVAIFLDFILSDDAEVLQKVPIFQILAWILAPFHHILLAF
jgi:hypothetical protein